VVSSTPKAFALERARRLEIPSVVVDPERKLSPEEFSRDAFVAAESFGASSWCSRVPALARDSRSAGWGA
jgi:folate-dependent phosphoribosylglycinamide formyltransferase PurN